MITAMSRTHAMTDRRIEMWKRPWVPNTLRLVRKIAIPATGTIAEIGPYWLVRRCKVVAAATTLHRLTSQYGPISAIVPVAGIAIFLTNLSVFGTQGRFHISILLSVIAWVLLIAVIIPRQKKTLEALESGSNAVDFTKAKKQLSMFGGIFNLLWIITALLMFV